MYANMKALIEFKHSLVTSL